MHSAKKIKTSDFYNDNEKAEKGDIISHSRGI
jgi:hypothetical protein